MRSLLLLLLGPHCIDVFKVGRAPLAVGAISRHCLCLHSTICGDVITISALILDLGSTLLRHSFDCFVERRGGVPKLLFGKRPQQAGLPDVHHHDVRHATLQDAGVHRRSQSDSLHT